MNQWFECFVELEVATKIAKFMSKINGVHGAKVNMPNLDTYRKLAWSKHGKVRKSYTLLVQRHKQPHIMVIQLETIIMIHIRVTNKVGHVVLNKHICKLHDRHPQKQILKFVKSTSIIVGFQDVRVKQTLKKKLLQNLWHTYIQYVLAKDLNYTHVS